MRLFNAVQPLLSDLLRSDSQFAVERGQIIRDVKVRVACSPVTLLAYTAALEAELAQRSRDETGKHKVSGRNEQFSYVEASAYAVGTRKSRPMCPHFLTPDGGPSGGECPLFHPKPYGRRCMNCGQEGHWIANCTRPFRKRPKQQNHAPDGAGKGSSSTGHPEKQQQQADKRHEQAKGSGKKGGKTPDDKGGKKGKGRGKGDGKSKDGKRGKVSANEMEMQNGESGTQEAVVESRTDGRAEAEAFRFESSEVSAGKESCLESSCRDRDSGEGRQGTNLIASSSSNDSSRSGSDRKIEDWFFWIQGHHTFSCLFQIYRKKSQQMSGKSALE